MESYFLLVMVVAKLNYLIATRISDLGTIFNEVENHEIAVDKCMVI